MQTYRVEVGHQHGVKPGNILGAIANEAEIDAQYIGRIEIFDDHSLVDMPEGMPRELLRELQKVWVAGQQLRMSKVIPEGKASSPPAAVSSDTPAKKVHRKGSRPGVTPDSRKH